MLNNLKIFAKRYGFVKGLGVYTSMKFNSSGELSLPDAAHPIHFNPGTIDEYSIVEIFGLGCYDIDFAFDPKLIIDAGANIGIGSVYLVNRYPNAMVYAIEPESNNYKQLIKNCSYYNQIKPIQSALWNNTGFVKVVDNGFGTRGFMIEECQENDQDAFRSTAIIDLIAEDDIIDILKLDIEGSEKALFESGYEEWLPRCRSLIIEFHDNMIPGCSTTVFDAIKRYNFSSYQKDENIVFINQDLA